VPARNRFPSDSSNDCRIAENSGDQLLASIFEIRRGKATSKDRSAARRGGLIAKVLRSMVATSTGANCYRQSPRRTQTSRLGGSMYRSTQRRSRAVFDTDGVTASFLAGDAKQESSAVERGDVVRGISERASRFERATSRNGNRAARGRSCIHRCVFVAASVAGLRSKWSRRNRESKTPRNRSMLV